MYSLDYNTLMLVHEERIRYAEKHNRGMEMLRETRAGRLSQLVRRFQRSNRPTLETTETRRAHAL